MAVLSSVSICFMMLSFASVQGFPSRPTSHQNAGYEDLLVRIEQALGHPGPPSRPKGFPDSYEDLLAMIEQRQGYCHSAGLSAGCCEKNCRTSTGCYCDSVCREHGDCCMDVHSTLCPDPLPAPAPSCVANGHINGCCTGGISQCSVSGANGKICHCDVECHAYDTCCGDIADINCFPQTCAQAGKSGCVTGPGELCDVITSQNGTGTCYCDADCTACCSDAGMGTDLDLLLLSELLRMKELARLMESSRSHDWTNARADNLRRRYRAGLLAQMQNY